MYVYREYEMEYFDSDEDTDDEVPFVRRVNTFSARTGTSSSIKTETR